MATSFTVARYLAERLAQIGAGHLFTIPGDYCAPFLDAMDTTKGIERVPNIFELGCGYAADGYARLTGVGAACVQYGVGTFSLLNCVAGSYTEFLPVAIISSSPGASSRLLEEKQNILFHHSTGNLDADRNVFHEVTVASIIIADPSTATQEIDRALTLMLTYRRPVYIEVINTVWSAPCSKPNGRIKALSLYSNGESLAQAVDAAYNFIAAASKPVLFFGVELQRFGLTDIAQKLVDVTKIPFVTTSLAKTVLDESQKLFAGTYAGPASTVPTNEFVLASDCIVALGTIITDDYLQIMADSFSKMLRVSQGETRVANTYFPEVTLASFLPALVAKLQSKPLPQKAPAPPVQAPLPSHEPKQRLTYANFFDTLGSFVIHTKRRDDFVLVLGESTSLYVFGNLFGLPRNSFVAQAAWGSLGHETGCALGLALADEEKRPLVIAGDGGFQMVCQEISSLVRAQSDTVIFVMSNSGFAIEQAFVDIKAFKPGGKYAPYNDVPRWNYQGLASAFGANFSQVNSVGDLDKFLATLGKRGKVPTLVEVVITKEDLAPQLERLASPTPPTLRRNRRLGAPVTAA